jgi:hypothetical protein
MIVYSKLGSTVYSLFRRQDGKWAVGASFKDQNIHAGFAHTEAGLPHSSLAKKWQVWNGEVWQQQSVMASVMVSLSHFV